jgi:hypothetical protein
VFAGECPADKIKPNARQMVDYKPVGVTDVTLGSIDLEKQPANIRDRELRFRKLTIEPGGIVPWHSHDDRPALIFVQQGEIVEYASNCVDPIVHKVGDIRPEIFGTSHCGRTSARKPSFSMSATSARTRMIIICNECIPQRTRYRMWRPVRRPAQGATSPRSVCIGGAVS